MGVLAAMEARKRLLGLGVVSSFGVTTGQAFLGIVGSPDRCEYTIMVRKGGGVHSAVAVAVVVGWWRSWLLDASVVQHS